MASDTEPSVLRTTIPEEASPTSEPVEVVWQEAIDEEVDPGSGLGPERLTRSEADIRCLVYNTDRIATALERIATILDR